MKIHAYRRTEPVSVNLTPVGQAVQEVVRFLKIHDNPPVIVADVTDERHIDLLLAVPEAYVQYDESNLTPVAQPSAAEQQRIVEEQQRIARDQRHADTLERQRLAAAEAADLAARNETLIGSSNQPSIIDLTGNRTVTLGEVVDQAHRASALTMAEWNELEQAEREAKIADQIEQLRGQAEHAEAEEQRVLAEQVEADKRAAADAAAAKAEAHAKRFTLSAVVDGKEVITDLATMSDTKVREYAKEYGVAIPANLKGEELRQHVVAELTKPATDEAKA